MLGVDTNERSDQLPAVVPRAGLPESGARVPLDQLIQPALSSSKGLVCLTAPPGGGKTSSLNYLRHVFGATPPFQCFDEESVDAALQFATTSIAVLATRTVDPGWHALAVLELKPWTMDDCIEYLAQRHRRRLPDVLAPLVKDPMFPALHGSPEMLTLVMDELAEAPVILSLDWFMRRRIRSLQVSERVRGALIAERLRIENSNLPGASWNAVDVGDLPGWFRHEVPQRYWVGEDIADRLARNDFPTCMENMQGKPFLDDIAAAVSRNPDAKRSLEAFISNAPTHSAVPMIASILLRADPEWRPPARKQLNLRGAVLRSAQWKCIDLPKANLVDADCTGADFADANLSKVQACNAVMNRARLSGAILFRADLSQSQLQNAILSTAQADRINLESADLSGSKLTDTKLSSALMNSAILNHANLSGAILVSAEMERAEIEGADFTNADLSGARLKHVDMSEAMWNGALFHKASVRSCNLEGLEIDRADFRRADLTQSLLTASRMIRGNFEGACLEAAGLAEIEWTGANLRNANLAAASFHLGSSRSGMVGSTIPCEGSRTGFYTDEFNEQTYKSAEEIRKACLGGADLVGAVLENTDFYLVDLRRARYTDEQRKHFQRCGAILVSRVPD